MRSKLKQSKQSGTFTLSPGTELYGELTLAGRKSSLYLHDKNYFPTSDIPHQYVTGVLRDLTKVSLIDCVIPPVPSSGSRGVDSYHFANVFPHFVALGDDYLRPDERNISAVDFLMDDANSLFCDFDAFGQLIDARPFIDQIANANGLNRRIITGADPQIFYFTGKREIFNASTALGKVSALHSPVCSPNSVVGGAVASRIDVSIVFEEEVDFHDAIFRASRVIEYLGMLVGRPQNLLDLRAHVALDRRRSVVLSIYWSLPPKRNSPAESKKPSSFDVLLDATRQPQEFARVLERWLERQHDWHGARWRFFNSFARQQYYDIDRLIASANMFDILPESAVPANVPMTDELKSAQSASRDHFCALPQSLERDGILAALGRMGKSSLKQKVRHRARQLVEFAGDWFPDLLMVTDEAVNCRNYYVHGGEPRFDYDRNFDAVTFFTDTLEFVFAASDLIEAGWDIRSWILRGTTMSHPFGRCLVNYPIALQSLKALFPRPRTVS
jgi:ApeA N-terminal domain 1